jgi:hypothetical protein
VVVVVVVAVVVREYLNSKRGSAGIALCGGKRDGEWGGLEDGNDGTFPPGYGGTGDGVYIGGGTNDASTSEPVEPPPPTPITACRSLA